MDAAASGNSGARDTLPAMDMRFQDTIEMYRRQYIGALNLGNVIPISPAGLRAEVAGEIKNAPGVANTGWIEGEVTVKSLAAAFDAEYTKFYNTKVLPAALPSQAQSDFVKWWDTTRRAALALLTKKPATIKAPAKKK